jgi:hypothetical protein
MTTRPRMITVSALPTPDAERMGFIYRVPGGSSTADSHWLARKNASNAYEWFQFDAAPVSGGAGTEYTEGDTDASITGGAILWEDASDTLRAVSSAKPLPVNVVSGGTSGTQYTEGDTDASVTGTAILWEDAGDTLRAVSASKPLPVDITDASVAVTGTFWQATQPVSGTVTANLAAGTNNIGDVDVASLPAVALDSATLTALETISVANFPATQPVSGTVTADAGTGPWPVTDNGGNLSIDDGGNSITVDGTFWQATQPVSGTVNANLNPGSSLIGAVQARGPTAHDAAFAIDPVGLAGYASATAPAAVSADGDVVRLWSDLNGRLVVRLAHTVGRNVTNYFNALPTVTTNTAALVSLTGYKSGAAVAATTTPAVVTAGKTYRITTLTATYLSLAAATAGIVQLRANLSGTVVVGSPLVWQTMVGTPAAVAGVSTNISVTFPEGLEFAAGTGIGVTILGVNATGVAAAGGYVLVSISGFEY